MIDLHTHILPGIDDGAKSIEASLRMARLAVADGITHMACTPHIAPGVYDNEAKSIDAAIAALADVLGEAQVPLTLVAGADVHLSPDLLRKLKSGEIPTLNGSRYFLLEPPHHVVPPRIAEIAEELIGAGFVPIVTHPERLGWIETHYDVIERLNDLGCRMQLTGDSLTGGFGRKALAYAQRLVDEGRVDIVASDSHSPEGRPPRLSAARDALAQRLGQAKADEMVNLRPAAILANQPLPPVRAARSKTKRRRPGLVGTLRRLARIEGK